MLTLHCQNCTPADGASQVAGCFLQPTMHPDMQWQTNDWTVARDFTLILSIWISHTLDVLLSFLWLLCPGPLLRNGCAQHAHDRTNTTSRCLLYTCNNLLHKKPTILWDSNTLHDEQTQSRQLESNLVRPFIQNFRIETRDAAGCKPRNSALK